ncbi:FdhF/YdeP family oxidoreductase [Brachybacterium sp. AOP25-B2-12]|uniref:FdhF/YdeP family oxidoreductase n=1 Tax=Brachybacterium sp. AOP25-B2-12 TaxID=3457710 RepID=UPI004033C8E6
MAIGPEHAHQHQSAFGLMPDSPRQGGYGPRTDKPWSQKPYHHPAAGWGAARSVAEILIREREPVRGPLAFLRMNHGIRGFDCPGCAWPDATGPLMLDFCENGTKHVTWEMTRKRTTSDFLAEHTVTELSTWTDYDLENEGRLVEPMVYDAETDHYVPIGWDEAFQLVADELHALDSPDEASFYTSGRLSNEATFLYQWMIREFGTNNMPDCSNMCHEASGRALTASIGTGKGTCDLEDWNHADALFILGVNAGSNAPRMLTALQEAHERGTKIVHVNPLPEVGMTRTIVPHEMVDMATFHATPTSTMNLQVRPGGDFALARAMAKVVFEAAEADPSVLDRAFLAEHSQGYEEYRAIVEATGWDELAEQSGLTEDQLRYAGKIYIESEATVFSWCLGVSQHAEAVTCVREFVNLLMLRGNIGRLGAGPSPVRGHSNVQGNRTCGVNHHPTQEWLDQMGRACGFTPPTAQGLDTVRTMDAMVEGRVKVFVGMGGNFVLATPDTEYTAQGLNRCRLTVQVSTKLNRSHLVHGEKALILPCLGRTERDQQEAGLQGITVEDAMSMVKLSVGRMKPASENLRSEPAIIAGIAEKLLPTSTTPWSWLVGDYARIRDVMADALPGFQGFNTLLENTYGFRIPQPARERVFLTPSGRAEFSHAPLPNVIPESPETIVLQTMRSHDQWNTTIYSDNDRYRGVEHLRELVLMNREDMIERGIADGSLVDIVSTSLDGSKRSVRDYRAIAYDTPRGTAAGYMPELNVLIGPKDFSAQSDQPLMKSIQTVIAPAAGREFVPGAVESAGVVAR